MNCTKCGNNIEPSAVFCGNCGQQVAVAQAQPVPVVAQPMSAQPVAAQPVVSQPMAAQPEAAQPVAAATTAQAPAPVAAVAMPSPSQQNPVPAQQSPFGQVPQYAIAAPSANGKTITGFVFGVLSIPASIIPIIGLGFGITAIVLGSKGKKAGKSLATATLVLGIIGAVLSLIVWGINIYQASN